MVFCFFSLTIAAVSITSLHYYINDVNKNLISKSIYQREAVEQIINTSEGLMGTATSLMNQFWKNNLLEIISFFVEKKQDPREKYQIIKKLYMAQSNFLQNGYSLSFLDLDTNMLYSPTGIQSFQSFLEEYEFDEEVQNKLHNVQISSEPYYGVSAHNQLLIVKPWSNATDNNKIIECYVFNLNMLHLSLENTDGCGFWIYHDGVSLFSLLGQGTLPSVAEYEHSSDVSVRAVHSLYFDLVYYYVVPAAKHQVLLNSFFVKILIPVLLILISLAFIYLLSHILYRPIKHLYTNALTVSKESESCYDNELLTVSDTLFNLHETIEQLQEKADATEELIRNKRIKDLLLGLSDVQKIDRYAKQLAIPVKNGEGSIIVIETPCCDNTSLTKEVKQATLLREILQKEKVHFDWNGLSSVLLPISLNRVCLLSAKDKRADLIVLARQIKIIIEREIHNEITTAICCIQKGESIPEAYLRVINILSSNHHTYNLMVEEKPDKNAKSQLYYNMESEKEMVKILQTGNHNAITALTTHIINQNLKANIPQQRIAQALYITVLRVIQDAHIENNYVNAFTSSKTLSPEIFTAQCIQTLITISNDIMEKNNKENRNFTQEAFDYIRDNYNKDISLTDVADHFQLSMVYMSTLFKKETGVNFKEYLTHMRVEEAKKLLKENYKVHDVAPMVGFHNVDSFIRMFKRITGVSPGKFNNKNE